MDNNLIAYRSKHKRCRYCKYNGYIGGGGYRVFNWCHAKQKKKADWLVIIPLHYIQGWLCSVYKPKED